MCTCARADATHPDLRKARIYWAPSHTQNLNAILPAVCEIWKRGVHLRTCRRTPPQTCRKHLSNGPLDTHKIWTQSSQPFARSGKRVCTCARAYALHLKYVSSTYLMGPLSHTKFERNRASRCGVTEGEGVFNTLSPARSTCRGRHRWPQGCGVGVGAGVGVSRSRLFSLESESESESTKCTDSDRLRANSDSWLT